MCVFHGNWCSDFLLFLELVMIIYIFSENHAALHHFQIYLNKGENLVSYLLLYEKFVLPSYFID